MHVSLLSFASSAVQAEQGDFAFDTDPRVSKDHVSPDVQACGV